MDDDRTNPLHPLHEQAQAQFQPYGAMQIVSTFGEPQAEYAAIRKSAGLMDLPHRGFLELTGADRLTFLNSILSAQIWDKQARQPLAAGRWVYSFLLNVRGRIVADMNVIELGDRTVLEVDRTLVEPLRQVLDAYLFAERVKMSVRSDDLHEIVLHGPAGTDVLSQVASAETPVAEVLGQPGACAMFRVFGHEVIGWRDDVTGSPGLHLIAPAFSARGVWMHLVTTHGQSNEPGKRRLRPVGWAAFNATRIEAGRPLLGIDFDTAPLASAMPGKQQRQEAEDTATSAGPGMLPAETGMLERAVSLTKCYIGQEIVARMHAREQVARKIVGIRMEDDALPIAGTQVFDSESSVVGVVTSSTNSPVLSNRAICLGTVKRPLFEVGTRLRIGAEGRLREGTVVPLPFVVD